MKAISKADAGGGASRTAFRWMNSACRWSGSLALRTSQFQRMPGKGLLWRKNTWGKWP